MNRNGRKSSQQRADSRPDHPTCGGPRLCSENTGCSRQLSLNTVISDGCCQRQSARSAEVRVRGRCGTIRTDGSCENRVSGRADDQIGCREFPGGRSFGRQFHGNTHGGSTDAMSLPSNWMLQPARCSSRSHWRRAHADRRVPGGITHRARAAGRVRPDDQGKSFRVFRRQQKSNKLLTTMCFTIESAGFTTLFPRISEIQGLAPLRKPHFSMPPPARPVNSNTRKKTIL